MKTQSAVLILSCCLASAAWPQTEAKHTLTKFNAPGAGTASGQGTEGAGIVENGAISGWYIDSNNLAHGFLRRPSGKFATFDPIGSQDPYPEGMNSTLSIAGYYLDSGTAHGFLRAPSGAVTTFDAPAAGTSSGQGTFAGNINAKGEIAGYYIDSSGVYYAFLRSPKGEFTWFDAPGAGTAAGQGTFPAGFDGLTEDGAVAGNFVDPTGTYHGFLRAPNGILTGFDPVGSVNTLVSGINSAETIVGAYFESTGGVQGFLRSADGAITSFDVPDAIITDAVNINVEGEITGSYYDSTGAAQGYVLSGSGNYTRFDVPDATGGTFPVSNNSLGVVAGEWVDSNGAYHGFVWQ